MTETLAHALAPNSAWSAEEPVGGTVDAYLARLPEPDRLALSRIRTVILVTPEATESMRCGFPTFELDGRTIAGLAASSGDLMYLPFSSRVLEELGPQVGHTGPITGAVHFTASEPISAEIVGSLVAARVAEVNSHLRGADAVTGETPSPD